MTPFSVGLAAVLAVTLAVPAATSSPRRDVIIFVREDPQAVGLNAGVDLWTTAAAGGHARRLVGGRGLRNLTRTPRLDERDPAWRPR
jgi:hypothetical protein